jgi:hypothetical protein
MKTLLLASTVVGALSVFARPALAHSDRYDRGYGDSYYQDGRHDYRHGERDGRDREHWSHGWYRHHERDWSYRHDRGDGWRGWHRHDQYERSYY